MGVISVIAFIMNMAKRFLQKRREIQAVFRCCCSPTIYFLKLAISNPFKLTKEEEKQSSFYFPLSKDLIKSVHKLLDEIRKTRLGNPTDEFLKQLWSLYIPYVCIHSGMFALLSRKLNEFYYLIHKNLSYRTPVQLIFFFIL